MFSVSVAVDVRKLLGAKVRINKAIARAVGNGVEEEFHQLVMETAQWTGQTAASWNVGYGMTAVSEGPAQGYSETDKFQAGHHKAVDDATNRARPTFEEYKNGEYTRGDLVIYNPHWLAEERTGPGGGGPPLRHVNAISAGAFNRFQSRVATKNYIVNENIIL